MNNKLLLIMFILLSSCAYAQYYNYFTDGTGTIYIPINTTAGQNYTIYIDPTASISYAANGANVFQFYDGFSGGALSGSWTCTGTCTVSGGEVAVTSTGGWLQSTSSYDNNTEVIMRVKTLATPDAGHSSVYGFGTASSNRLIAGFSSSSQTAFVNNIAVACSISLSTSYSTFSLWRNSTLNSIIYQDDINKCILTGANTGGEVLSAYNYQSAQTIYIDWVALRNRSSTEPNVTSSGSSALYSLDIRAGATNTNQVIKVTGLSITGNVAVYDNLSNFTVTAIDNITGLAINTFNATITWNGTSQFYSTTSGQIVTNITRNSELINITLRSNNYLNLTNTSFNITSQFDGRLQPTQFEVDFNVSELITNNSITNYTINFQGSSNVSGVNPRINMSVGTYNITFLNNSYFNKTIYAVSITSNTTVNFTDVNAYYLNVSARNIYTGANETTFTATITSGLYSYSTTVTTTNGTVYVPWIADTNINISLTNATSIADTSTVWNTSNYTARTIVNISLSSATINNILFSFYDEQTLILLNGYTVTSYLTSAIYSTNFTTTNGSYFIGLLAPSNYTITSTSPGYNDRQFYINITNHSGSFVSIYLLNSSNSTRVQITVTNENAVPVVGAVVEMERRNLSGTNYYIVDECVTDINGQCLVSAQLSTGATTVTYRFLVIYQGVPRGDTGDTQLASNTLAIRISLLNNPLNKYFEIPNLFYGLTNFSTSGQVNFTIADTSGNTESGCLSIFKRVGSGYTLESSSCTSGSSFVITLTTNLSLGDESLAQATIFVEGNETLVGTSTYINNNVLGSSKNYVALFIIFPIMTTLMFIFSFTPIGPPIVGAFFLYMMFSVGLFNVATTTITAIMIIGFVLIARSKT